MRQEKAKARIGTGTLTPETENALLQGATAGTTRRGALSLRSSNGVWGALPIIVLDVYEHAYFSDYGADRKT